jgi:hypothetical protein
MFFMFGIMRLMPLVLFGGSGMGIPLGVPPLPEDPVLAQVAPEECLFYTSWAGTAEADPQSANQTEQLLAEPEVQHLVNEVERLIRNGLHKAAMDEGGPEAAALADDAVGWVKTLLTRPTALFISKLEIDPKGPRIRAGAVVNLGEDAARLKASLEKHQEKFLRGAAQPVEIGGQSWYRITLDPDVPPITWGVTGQYFAVGVGEGMIEEMLKRVGTDPPAWLADIGRQVPVARRSTVTYINVRAVGQVLTPMVPEQVVTGIMDALGLSNVTSLVAVTGLDEAGFVSKTVIGLDGEPQGILSLAAAEPLAADDLAPIPRDATIAMAARLNADQVLETILSIVGKIEPRAREEMLRGLGEMQEELGFDLRRDLLQTLGDTWCVYNSPGEGGLVITGLTGVVPVKDHGRLAATHARFLARARAEFGDSPRSPRIDEFQFAGQTVYVFNARDDDVPVAPAWCLTEKEFVIAPYPQNVKAYLSHGDEHRSIAEVPEVAGLFGSGGGPIMLCYTDTQALFELVYPLIPIFGQVALSELARQGIDVSVSILPSAKAIRPHLRPGVSAMRRTEAGIEIISLQSLPGGNVGASVPVGVALLLPAVHSARGAARRATSMNNMKQIALALHNYHDVYKSFPPAYSTDKEGKPLLSWRVLILPFLEQGALYDQFHLDEPWDSEHNKRLSQMVVPTYRAPGSSSPPWMTNYLGVGGEHGIFRGKDPVRFADIRDGSSNTIMIVEANDQSAVPWAKPDDFQPDADNVMGRLVGLRPGGFNAGLADGSVRFISETISGEVLQLLFSRDDGQPIPNF